MGVLGARSLRLHRIKDRISLRRRVAVLMGKELPVEALERLSKLSVSWAVAVNAHSTREAGE